jgi:hypothetical protein
MRSMVEGPSEARKQHLRFAPAPPPPPEGGGPPPPASWGRIVIQLQLAFAESLG